MWPEDLEEDGDYLEALIEVYRRRGFESCESDSCLEDGYVKIAIYGHNEADGTIWEHVAVQQDSGLWKSKMGIDHEDIEHPRPESVADGFFGQVLCFMRRARAGTQDSI